ncbi:hypothetical protein TVNIR_2635 [Thioalkalivibrio nitratireducens DSM 14787]|uniref:Uncharacterized protein n=1 Tax=Thioalkalivibrio nitratireducens (strain DSM 14787 / UNIQEM 213 / ALEN2) TaxID=1255043 RepID=L0E0U6_THIND|nr:hypothetical protein [Thioalkalivibrio nitratireducens]AGA34276.1 hypothetical protein TVNIR_2635 [Thioalkalivibrio nitratireducens DSM 14787]
MSDTDPRGLRLAAVLDDTDTTWQDFYPEGLPEDWRFAFYGHYWGEILIPRQAWGRFATNAGWVSELPEAFQVYFEVPPGAAHRCDELLQLLGGHLGGCLLEGEGNAGAGLLPAVPVYLRRSDPALEGVRSCRYYTGSGGGVLVLEPERGLALPGWRRLLESLRGGFAEPSLQVFLRTGPQELENAETIRRLAGLA